ncbi:MAG TPA: sensor domain-containing diguanylate cyclase [Solirubrobacteraceae bacterium]|jgi:diguanylate cyclase (GGDEF)-like protein|nr:sensor domain-containing diguanylate cyclase [Solirubrobacteraceae bacterium]
MGVVTGTDTSSASSGGVDSVLAGVRRLSLLADGARNADAVLRALARELLRTPGAEEVHIHHLGEGDAEEEPVAVYMFDGDGRLSYLLPRAERPPGVSWVASTGRSLLIADARELAESVPRLAATGATSSALLLPLAERGAVEAIVMLVRRLSGAFDERSVDLARTLVDQAAAALALVQARAEAGTDAVAGCMNHRAMRRRIDEEIGRATRAGSPLSCILIDLDDFKLVNDQHGHQAGDAVLREVVQALVGEFRAFDRVARYGGDEFVVILPNADLRDAAAAATRALERLRVVSALGNETGTSASIGVAQWHAPMGTDELLEACDLALLRSKREGKGRVTRASEPVA